MPSVALVPRPRIGDSLVAMVIAENLRRTGREVVVFSTLLGELAPWFPHVRSVDREPSRERDETYGACDLRVLQSAQAAAGFPPGGPPGGDVLVLGSDPLLDRDAPRVEGYLAICHKRLAVDAPVRGNGMEPPPGVTPRAHPRRVVLCPGAADPRREWRPAGFLAVARGLAARGDEPLFLVERGQRAAWERRCAGRFPLASHGRLGEVARLLCESGAFVGNDSGIGHLASSVGTPTVTLFVRRRPAVHWRPAWSPSEALLPRFALPGTWLRYRTWGWFLGPARVLAALERLGVG